MGNSYPQTEHIVAFESTFIAQEGHSFVFIYSEFAFLIVWFFRASQGLKMNCKPISGLTN